MSYLVLARKYRPQQFSEVVGQSHVTTTLVNALKAKKVAHAYLFSGPRGVGKTTTARLLAKALNCEKGLAPEPCNACPMCQGIASGLEMMDVLEIDGASNRGIDEIRELRENARYAPARSRYKIYIIDEAHQITGPAFEALLKTLEEPPPHVVFMLATTEPHKVPTTILSRCQRFRFRRLATSEIREHLGRIAQAEALAAEPGALDSLASAAAGSVRDALSLLDQAIAFSEDKLSAQGVSDLLGLLPEDLLVSFAQALTGQAPTAILEQIHRLSEGGWEYSQFLRDFREFLRGCLVRAFGEGNDARSIMLGSCAAPVSEVIRWLHGFGACLEEMRWSDHPRLVLELHSLRLAQPKVDARDLVERLEALEQRLSLPEQTVIAKSGATKQSDQEGRREGEARGDLGRSRRSARDDESSVARNDAPGILQQPAREGEAVDVPLDLAIVRPLWNKLLHELWKRPAVASLFELAKLQSASSEEWTVAFREKYPMDAAQRSSGFIEECLQQVVGKTLKVRFVLDSMAPPSGPEGISAGDLNDQETVLVVEESPPVPATEEWVSDEGVQKILSHFKGTVRSKGSPPEARLAKGGE